MRKKILLASTLTLSIVMLSLASLPATPSKPNTLPDLLNASARDIKPNGCVNCHQPRPDIGRDLRLSVLTSNTKNHTDRTADAISSSEIPTVCKTCHENQLGNTLHLIHLGYEINPENNSNINYMGECLYCHAPNRSTGKMSFKTGYEAKP